MQPLCCTYMRSRPSHCTFTIAHFVNVQPTPHTTGSHNVLTGSGFQGVTQTHPHFCGVTKIEGRKWDQRRAAATASSLHMICCVSNLSVSQSLQWDVSPASSPLLYKPSPLRAQLFLLARQGDRRSARSRVKPCCNLTMHSSLVSEECLSPDTRQHAAARI